jgi:hypothetical protein
MLDACLASVVSGLHVAFPEYVVTVAIDGSDLPDYANGQKCVSSKSKVERKRFSDPGATWGHRSSISTRKGG